MQEPSKRVRLIDIAERAGVHLSTVSLALKNSPRLALETRKQIQNIASELGYTRDPHLQALAAYREKERRHLAPPVLAYVTHWGEPIEQVPHHRYFYHGAVHRARELGFKLEHFSLADPAHANGRLRRILTTRGIDGVILSSFYKGAPTVDLDWDNIAATRIEMQPSSPDLPSVAVDHIQVIREAVRNVLRLGYRRPGLLIGEDWSPLVDHRWEMGLLWAQQALPPADRLPVFHFVKSTEGTHRRYRFASWFAEQRPDVLLGPAAVIQERLADLPGGAAAGISFADPFLEQPTDGVAGVVHRLEEIGAAAVDTLCAMVSQHRHGIPHASMETFVRGYWVDGASCPARHGA